MEDSSETTPPVESEHNYNRPISIPTKNEDEEVQYIGHEQRPKTNSPKIIIIKKKNAGAQSQQEKGPPPKFQIIKAQGSLSNINQIIKGQGNLSNIQSLLRQHGAGAKIQIVKGVGNGSKIQIVRAPGSTPKIQIIKDPADVSQSNVDPFTVPKIVGIEGSATKIAGTESSTPEIVGTDSSAPNIAGTESSTPEIIGAESIPPEIARAESIPPEIARAESSPPEIARAESIPPEIVGIESSVPKVFVTEGSTIIPKIDIESCTSKMTEIEGSTSTPKVPEIEKQATSTPVRPIIMKTYSGGTKPGHKVGLLHRLPFLNPPSKQPKKAESSEPGEILGLNTMTQESLPEKEKEISPNPQELSEEPLTIKKHASSRKQQLTSRLSPTSFLPLLKTETHQTSQHELSSVEKADSKSLSTIDMSSISISGAITVTQEELLSVSEAVVEPMEVDDPFHEVSEPGNNDDDDGIPVQQSVLKVSVLEGNTPSQQKQQPPPQSSSNVQKVTSRVTKVPSQTGSVVIAPKILVLPKTATSKYVHPVIQPQHSTSLVSSGSFKFTTIPVPNRPPPEKLTEEEQCLLDGLMGLPYQQNQQLIRYWKKMQVVGTPLGKEKLKERLRKHMEANKQKIQQQQEQRRNGSSSDQIHDNTGFDCSANEVENIPPCNSSTTTYRQPRKQPAKNQNSEPVRCMNYMGKMDVTCNVCHLQFSSLSQFLEHLKVRLVLGGKRGNQNSSCKEPAANKFVPNPKPGRKPKNEQSHFLVSTIDFAPIPNVNLNPSVPNNNNNNNNKSNKSNSKNEKNNSNNISSDNFDGDNGFDSREDGDGNFVYTEKKGKRGGRDRSIKTLKEKKKCVKCSRQFFSLKWYANHIKVCNPKARLRKGRPTKEELDARRNALMKEAESMLAELDQVGVDVVPPNVDDHSDLLVTGDIPVPVDPQSSAELEKKARELAALKKKLDKAKKRRELAAADADAGDDIPQEYICYECGKEFHTAWHLETHSKIHVKSWECQVCSKSFTIASRLKVHMRVHTGEKPYPCEFCDRSFRTRPQLNNHKPSHSVPDGKPFKCVECRAQFTMKSSFRKHMKDLHPPSGVVEKPHVCSWEGCDKRFLKKANMEIHMRSHTGEKPYICAQCGKGFRDRSSLNVHSETHNEPLLCTYCGKSFVRLKGLQVHEQYCQTGELSQKNKGRLPAAVVAAQKRGEDLPPGLVECDVCHRGFSSRQNMENHRLIHFDVFPFKCRFCPREFKWSGSKYVHERTHTRSSKYKCPIENCTVSFDTIQAIKRHCSIAHSVRVHKEQIEEGIIVRLALVEQGGEQHGQVHKEEVEEEEEGNHEDEDQEMEEDENEIEDEEEEEGEEQDQELEEEYEEYHDA